MSYNYSVHSVAHTVPQSNHDRGKGFEEVVRRSAQSSGFFIKKNELSCRLDYRGRPILIKSQLDYLIIAPGPQVGFFDCKNFSKDYFVFSEINPSQLEQAVLFNERGVPSGFIVLFALSRRVVFFTGLQVDLKGPGARFVPDEGQGLGKLENINLGPLFSKMPAQPDQGKDHAN